MASTATVACEPDPLAVLFTPGVAALLPGSCPAPAADIATQDAERYGHRVRVLTARFARTLGHVCAARLGHRRDAQLARRTGAKARAVRLTRATDVSCRLRDGPACG